MLCQSQVTSTSFLHENKILQDNSIINALDLLVCYTS